MMIPNSSIEQPPMEEGPIIFDFNLAMKYMVDTPVDFEAQIAVKELELLHEYETHKG